MTGVRSKSLKEERMSWEEIMIHNFQNCWKTPILRFKTHSKFSVHYYCCSVTKLCLTPCDHMDCSMPGFLVFHHLWNLDAIELVILSNYIILCRPLLLLPSIFHSMRVFSNESALCKRWPKFYSASALFLPMNIQGLFPLELTGLISLQSKRLSRAFFSTTKASNLQHSSHSKSINTKNFSRYKLTRVNLQNVKIKRKNSNVTREKRLKEINPKKKKIINSWFLSNSSINYNWNSIYRSWIK